MGRDRRIWMLVIAAAVIAVDRWTKQWVGKHLGLGQAIDVVPKVFRITHVLNTGAAFSMFENMNENTVRNLLMAFSVIAVIVVLVLLWKLGSTTTWLIFLKCTSFTITGRISMWRIAAL